VARPPAELDAWCSPFAYVGVARELVARVKYRGLRGVVPWLSAALADEVSATGWQVDVVTWAPTTPVRRRARGFDPAEVLARRVACCLRRPVRPLLRRGPGPPQTGRSRAERRHGPQFAPRGAMPARVLLIDDVATTGATLAGAARALRSGGAGSVVAATVARTPLHGAPEAVPGLPSGQHPLGTEVRRWP